jgi:hypothetical protein
LINELEPLVYEGISVDELKEKSALSSMRAFNAKFKNLVRYGVCYKENGIIHLGFKPVQILTASEVINTIFN